MDEQRSPLKSELKFLERLSMEELEALLKIPMMLSCCSIQL